MTREEGKQLLIDCMEKCKCTEAIDDIIIYKTGNRQYAAQYQHDTISTAVAEKDFMPKSRFVIKCFNHMEIYIAWDVAIGRGNGKYICYKRNIAEMEDGQLPKFYTAPTIQGKRVYFFKGREGVMEFVRNVIAT